MWESQSPGVARRPARSITLVDGPIRGSMSAAEPAASTCPAQRAIASATPSVNPRKTRPLVRTMSALGRTGMKRSRWKGGCNGRGG